MGKKWPFNGKGKLALIKKKKEGKSCVNTCGCLYLTGVRMKGREVKEQIANCVLKTENLHGEA